jgi:predicted regulator of Ras-like GTPase activity (Roadblock/LC7/MglB family)
MASTTSQLKNIVNELQSSNTVNAAAIIRRDGILMASNFPPKLSEKDVFAMMSATILGAAKNISTKHAMGQPSKIIIETDEGNIIISGAGSKALLVCLKTDGLENEGFWKTLQGAEEKVKDLF